jgi:hypothetical protein
LSGAISFARYPLVDDVVSPTATFSRACLLLDGVIPPTFAFAVGSSQQTSLSTQRFAEHTSPELPESVPQNEPAQNS